MTKEFSIGDKVRRINSPYQGMSIGDEDIVVSIGSSTAVNLKKFGTGHSIENLDLVKVEKTTLTTLDFHIAVKDSCGNIMNSQIENSYQDAINRISNPENAQTYTIYKLIPVAKVERSVKISKLKTTSTLKAKRGRPKKVAVPVPSTN